MIDGMTIFIGLLLIVAIAVPAVWMFRVIVKRIRATEPADNPPDSGDVDPEDETTLS